MNLILLVAFLAGMIAPPPPVYAGAGDGASGLVISPDRQVYSGGEEVTVTSSIYDGDDRVASGIDWYYTGAGGDRHDIAGDSDTVAFTVPANDTGQTVTSVIYAVYGATTQWASLDIAAGVPGDDNFSGGYGTSDSPYLIGSKADLTQLATDVNSNLGNAGGAKFNVLYYRQTGYIDLGTDPWTPIGGSSQFKGYYDGGGHDISGLYIDQTAAGSNGMGLFGYLKSATVKNVNIISPNITVAGSQSGSTTGTGALAGVADGSAVSNCTARGGSIASDYRAGGLIGLLQASTMGATASVKHCYTSVSVSSSGSNGVGGVVGFIQFANASKDGVITVGDCYATGDVSCSSDAIPLAGGVVGGNMQSTMITAGSITIQNCYATGWISGNAGSTTGAVGGITGTPNTSTSTSAKNAQIIGCAALNKGVKNLQTNTNDLFGRISGAAKASSFTGNIAWDRLPVNGAVVTGGSASDKNGAGTTMAQLKTKDTWVALGFDFTGDAGAWEWDDALYFPRLSGLTGQDTNPFPDVAASPAISGEPGDCTVTAGQSASFSVTASGDAATLAYHWQSSADSGITWAAIDGVSGAVYSVDSATREMSGWQYRCVVTDQNGSATSQAATLTVNDAPPETAAQEQLSKVKDFYTANKSLTAPLEATALHGAGVDLNGYNTDALTESAYYLKPHVYNDQEANITPLTIFDVIRGSATAPSGLSVPAQLSQLILDSIALGKDPADLNGKDYVQDLLQYQNKSGPQFDGSDDGLALLALRAYWGADPYPLQSADPQQIGEAACLSSILSHYPASGYFRASDPNYVWGLNASDQNKQLLGTFWMAQGLFACADPSQLNAGNTGKSLTYLDSEYAKTSSNMVTASCELLSAYIMSRLSAGETVDETVWQKLAQFQLPDGSYRRKLTDTVSNRESTAMALLALDQNADPAKESAFSKPVFGDSNARATAAADIEATAEAVTAITLNQSDNTISLPTVGENGTTVAWSSSDPDVIAADGTITPPADGPDVTVGLIADVTRGTALVRRSWIFTVGPLDKSFDLAENFAKLKTLYQNKHILDTPGEPLAVLSGMGSLDGFGFNLPYNGAYNSNATYSEVSSNYQHSPEAIAVLDTLGRGGNPRDYTSNVSGSSNTMQVDLIRAILDKQQADGSLGSDYQQVYYTLALEAYFNGQLWGNEQPDADLGRIGAIKHILGRMIDYPMTGGRAYSQIMGFYNFDWFQDQCALVMLLSRWVGDTTEYAPGRTIGHQAQQEMAGLLKSLEYLFHEDFEYATDDPPNTSYPYGSQSVLDVDNHNGSYTQANYQLNADGSRGAVIGTPTTTQRFYVPAPAQAARYVSALVAAGQKDKVADYGVLDRLRNACLADGSYNGTGSASDTIPSIRATAAVMTALGDLANNRSMLSTISFDTNTVSDSQAVSADLAALSIPETATGNLNLSTAGANGSAITWTTGNSQAITTTGVVTRPAQGQPDAVVTLIATARRGAALQQRVFSVTVPAAGVLSDQEAAQADLAALSLPVSTIRNIALPASGANGSAIAWVSGNPSVITNDGAVTRPAAGSAAAAIILTATATKNQGTATRDFTVTIPALSDNIVSEAVYAIREQYNTDTALTGTYWDVFAAKSVLGDDFDQYNFSLYDVTKHRQDSPWQPTDYSAVILQILATGGNPYDYKGINYVQGLLDYYQANQNWGPYACPGWSGMALEAAGADISDAARNAYIGYCKAQLSDLSYGPDMAGWDLIVLANHLDYNGVRDAINGLRETLKASQEQSGDYVALFNTGGVAGGSITMSNGCVVSGFEALTAAGLPGFDLSADEWRVNGVSPLDTLYQQEIEGRDSFNTQIALEFGDAYYGDSVWRRAGITTAQFDAQIRQAEATIAGAGDRYTPESLQALQVALAAAETVRGDSERMAKRAFGQSYFTLREATDNLVDRGAAALTIMGDTATGILLPRTELNSAATAGKSIAYILNSTLSNHTSLACTLDADGGVSSLAGLAAGENAAWYCYVNGQRVTAPLTAAMLNDGNELVFKYCADETAVAPGATLDQQIVAEAAAALAIAGDLTAVTANLNLPQQGAFGSAVTWTSDNPSILSGEGIAHGGAADTSVRLTATVAYGEAAQEKTFDVTVKAAGASAGYDLNGDDLVNVQDLVLVGQHFAETGTPGWIAEDINRDGRINVQDLVLVGQNFSS